MSIFDSNAYVLNLSICLLDVISFRDPALLTDFLLGNMLIS